LLLVYFALLSLTLISPDHLSQLVLPLALTTLCAYHALGCGARTENSSRGIAYRLLECVRIPALALLPALFVFYGSPVAIWIVVTLLLLPYYAAVGLALAAWLRRGAGLASLALFAGSYLLVGPIVWIGLLNPLNWMGPLLVSWAWPVSCGTGRRHMLELLMSTPGYLLPVVGLLLLSARAGFNRRIRAGAPN